MTPEEIKSECEYWYDLIKKAETGLRELRENCKHENTFEGDYSWRIGSTSPATICSYCGVVVNDGFKSRVTLIDGPLIQTIPLIDPSKSKVGAAFFDETGKIIESVTIPSGSNTVQNTEEK